MPINKPTLQGSCRYAAEGAREVFSKDYAASVVCAGSVFAPGNGPIKAAHR